MTQKSQQTSLNHLLATISIFQANLKVYHWLMSGDNFFVLHEKFGEFYDFLGEHQDKLAERILALRETPMIGYSNYLKHSEIKETDSKIEKEFLNELLISIQITIKLAQKAKEESKNVGDDETDNYLQEMIYELQKNAWMYSKQSQN
jgi:starvation-inducible DNA-binding protein